MYSNGDVTESANLLCQLFGVENKLRVAKSLKNLLEDVPKGGFVTFKAEAGLDPHALAMYTAAGGGCIGFIDHIRKEYEYLTTLSFVHSLCHPPYNL